MSVYRQRCVCGCVYVCVCARALRDFLCPPTKNGRSEKVLFCPQEVAVIVLATPNMYTTIAITQAWFNCECQHNTIAPTLGLIM